MKNNGKKDYILRDVEELIERIELGKERRDKENRKKIREYE